MHKAVEIHADLPQRLHGEDILVGPENIGGFVQVALEPHGQVVERRAGIPVPAVRGLSEYPYRQHRPIISLIPGFYMQPPRPIITNNGSSYRYVSDYQTVNTLFGHFPEGMAGAVRTFSVCPE